MSELIERLRGLTHVKRRDVELAAADEIERLTSDLMNKNRMMDIANDRIAELEAGIGRVTAQGIAEGRIVHRCNERIAKLEALIRDYPLTNNRPTDLAIELACWKERAKEALQEVETDE